MGDNSQYYINVNLLCNYKHGHRCPINVNINASLFSKYKRGQNLDLFDECKRSIRP